MAAPKPYNTGLTEEQIAEAFRRAINDMTDEQITSLLDGKVDKQEGFSLISTAERAKLSTLENYDDTEVKSEIALNRSTLGYQRKNLLKNTAVSQTINGVTYTVNEDGSITANGTATANAQIVIFDGKPSSEMFSRKLRVSGCPDGGSASTYRLVMQNATSGFSTLCSDSGGGSDLTIASDITRIRCLFTIYSGQTVENITVYPMLRYAEITDDTYEPYKPSVEERLAALEEKFVASESGAE